MASTGHGSSNDADFTAHVKTWHGFMSFVRWQIGGIVIILVLLAIFRTH